jgi:hypothetical protein
MAIQSNVPEWRGDPKKLPPEGQLFVYKDRTYRWQSCSWSYDRTIFRPVAYNQKGSVDRRMTILIRGDDPGDVVLLVLMQFGECPESLAELSPSKVHDLLLRLAEDADLTNVNRLLLTLAVLRALSAPDELTIPVPSLY